MAKRFPINPPHPERNCWGCDRYCPSSALMCGNGSERTQHPVEFFGPDWDSWTPPQESPAPNADNAVRDLPMADQPA